MRGPFESNFPFGGHFAHPFAGMGRPPLGCPFSRDSSDHHGRKPAFGPFGWLRFDSSPERHCYCEPEHPRCSSRGSPKCHCCGSQSRGRNIINHFWFGRRSDQHCCERRGKSGYSNCHCRRTCEGSRGCDHHRSTCCRHSFCCDQRKSSYDKSCEKRSGHCENCCLCDSCCCGNKKDCECDKCFENEYSALANERDYKFRMVVLWLVRELFWKTLKGHHFSHTNM